MSRGSPFQSLIGLFSRFRVLILLMLVGALGLTAVAFIVFTQKEVTRSMLNAGDESALNVLKVVKLNVENQYRDLEYFRQYAHQRYEQQLKNVVSVVVSQVDFFHDLEKRRVLSHEQAQRAALESVQRIRYGNNDYFFIYDADNIAISHADPNMRGRDVSGAKDMDGRPVLKIMRESTRKSKDGFCTIRWIRLGETKPVSKLLYFYYYPQWDWLIGTGVYIDDIDADTQKKMNQIITDLKKTFADVKVAETGYFTLFDGKGKILIHPILANTDGSQLTDVVTGRKHLQDLMAASKNPAVPWKYLWSKPDYPDDYRFVKYSHVEYFAPFDWYVSSSVYEDEMQRPAEKIVRRQAAFVGLVVIVSMIGVYFLVSRVTRPLASLAEHADVLQKNDFVPSEEGDRELRSITFPHEIGNLSRAFLNMEGRLEEYVRNLKETTAARERLESELRIARDIQMSMLPIHSKALEGRTEIDLAAALEPAREVGGDFYDYFFIDERQFCFLVGDVSDKGVPAALFMARSNAMFRSAARRAAITPDGILHLVNQELTDGNEMRMFITVCLGILNVDTGELTFSNAGHVHPILVNDAGGCTVVEPPVGKPLGITKKAVFTMKRLQLNRGEGLLVFTDGVTEAINRDGGFFGDDRLLALLREMKGPGQAGRYVDAVFREVGRFSGGAPRFDDIAVLCVRFKGEIIKSVAV
jgi:sigma-B regulation protein RsbU (phosphoserine phosphatase)